jgi:hypothetical protein
MAAVLKRGRAGVASEERVLGTTSLEELAVLREGRSINIVVRRQCKRCRKKGGVSGERGGVKEE